MVVELKNLLDIYHQETTNRLGIRKTPETYINTKSSPEEVCEWLKSKEFDIVYVFH